jgi:hypothetical protein
MSHASRVDKMMAKSIKRGILDTRMNIVIRYSLLIAVGIFLVTMALSFRSHPSVQNAVLGNPLFRHLSSEECRPNGVVAGVIRNDGEGWAVINDQEHTPINISYVESNARGIVIGFSFVASEIHTFIVGSDETLSRAGIFAGASVDTDKARIVVSRNSFAGPIIISPLWVETGKFPFSNFWIYGLFSAECP